MTTANVALSSKLLPLLICLIYLVMFGTDHFILYLWYLRIQRVEGAFTPLTHFPLDFSVATCCDFSHSINDAHDLTQTSLSHFLPHYLPPPLPSSTTFWAFIMLQKMWFILFGLLYSAHHFSLSVCIHVLVDQETASDPTNSNSRLLRSSTLSWPSSSYLAYVILQRVVTRLLRAGAVSCFSFPLVITQEFSNIQLLS